MTHSTQLKQKTSYSLKLMKIRSCNGNTDKTTIIIHDETVHTDRQCRHSHTQTDSERVSVNVRVCRCVRVWRAHGAHHAQTHAPTTTHRSRHCGLLRDRGFDNESKDCQLALRLPVPGLKAKVVCSWTGFSRTVYS